LLNDWTTMFPGMTLIATPTPQKFLENFSKFLSKFRANFNLQKEIDAFDKKIEIYEKMMEQKEKAIASANEKKIVRDEDGTAEVRTQEGGIDAFNGIERPEFRIPSFLKVNSKEHCDSICKKSEIPCQHCDNHHDRHPNGEETVDGIRLIDLNIDEDLILLLLAGIGVWSKTITSPQYRSLVLRFASNNMLAYVVADETICFGTNYPFNRVIITEEFSQVHSMETIFQVIARAGRLGLIFKAEAFIPDSLLGRFKEYSMSNVDSAFDEGKNISSATINSFFQKKFELFAETCEKVEKECDDIFEMKNNLFKSETFLVDQTIEKIEIQQIQTDNSEKDDWDSILDEIERELPKETKEISKIEPMYKETQLDRQIFGSTLSETKQEKHPLDRGIFGSAILQEKQQNNKTTNMFNTQQKDVIQSKKYVPPSRR
jgi:hypothetical protein